MKVVELKKLLNVEIDEKMEVYLCVNGVLIKLKEAIFFGSDGLVSSNYLCLKSELD